LPYHSPYKFRHGFTVYALKHAKNIGQLKAISQNLMHKNISIIDGIYGILSESNVKDRISSLGTENISSDKEKLQELLQLYKELIKMIESKIT
jgi:hypothetical protein